MAGEGAAAVAQGDATDEARLVDIGFDFVHVRTGSGTADAVNTSPREGFRFDRDQFAATADVVMELAVGNQHARKANCSGESGQVLCSSGLRTFGELGHCG